MYENACSSPTPSLNVKLLANEDVAIAEASIWIGGSFYWATGAAKRDPQDSYDPEIGEKLAAGRAIRQLGREILKEAQFYVREADKKKRHQAEAAQRARAAKAVKAKEFEKAKKKK